MGSRAFDCRKLAGLFAGGLLLTVAGCQSGGGLAGLGIGGGGNTAPAVADDRPTMEELLVYCPPLAIPNAGAILSNYQRGGDGDASKLVYRASISDATRTCSQQPGSLTMTLAVAGRVVPGPVGTTGTVTLPIRVTVYRDAEQVYSQLHQYGVNVADTAGATQFVFTESNVVIPTPTARNIRAVISFEQPSR